MMNGALLEAALSLNEAGNAVIAVNEDKKPYLDGWNQYFERPQSATEVREHFQNRAHGLALVLWPASPYLAIDFDGQHAAQAWQSTGIALPLTARNYTRGGGLHLYFRISRAPDFDVKRKVRVAKIECECKRPDGKAKPCGVDLLINGYVVMPPTPGYQEDPEHPFESAIAVPDEVLALARKQPGITMRLTGDAAGRVGQGERNSTACSLAGTMRARGMSIKAIRAALRADNADRFDPPLDDSEIDGILRQVEKWSPGSGHSNDGVLNSQNSQPAQIQPAIEPAAFHGLAGEIVDTISPYSESDPIAILVNVLTGFGNIVGPGPHHKVEKTEHGLNAFVVQVGRSSKGRKGTAWSTPKFMLEAIDKDWGEKRVRSGVSSGEGLVNTVRDERYEKRPIREKGRTVDYEYVLVDEGEKDKRLLCVEEEFSQCLKVMSREGNILSPILRDAWDGKRLAPMTKNSPIEATGAHISVIGHITRDELLRYFNSTEQTNGFGNRFLWFFVKRSKEIPTPTGCPDEMINPLIDRLGDAVSFARKVTTIARDDEAEAIWQSVYHDLSAESEGLVGALLSRSEAQVMRLACLYALLDCSGKVKSQHLEAALALWAYVEQSCRFIFGGLKGDPSVDRALQALKLAGSLTTTEIYGLFGRHADKAEVERVIGELCKIAGVSSEKTLGTGGRPSLTLVWTAKKAN